MAPVDNDQNAIAVIDDDPAVLASLKFLLQIEGYVVSTYASAASFLEDDATHPRCLITDYNMPQMTGLALAARLRIAGVNIPILLMTATPSAALRGEAASLGISKVLEKPMSEDDLLSFVKAHV